MCVSPAHKKKKKRKKAEVWLWIVIALVFVNAACLHCKQQHLVLLLRLSQLTAGDLFPLPCRVRGGGMAQGDYWAGRSGRSARVSAFPLQLLILCACVCVCWPDFSRIRTSGMSFSLTCRITAGSCSHE